MHTIYKKGIVTFVVTLKAVDVNVGHVGGYIVSLPIIYHPLFFTCEIYILGTP